MATTAKLGRLDSTVMFPKIELFQLSGMTKKQFCEEMDFKLHTFTYWLNKYRKSDQPKLQTKPKGDFVSLDILPATKVKESVRQIRITYPDGTLIELPI